LSGVGDMNLKKRFLAHFQGGEKDESLLEMSQELGEQRGKTRSFRRGGKVALNVPTNLGP